MLLAQETLSFIPDDSDAPVSSFAGGWELAQRTNALRTLVPSLSELTPASPGSLLKSTVISLPPNLQADVLAPLLNKATPGMTDAQHAPTVTQLDELEDKKLKRWLVKILARTLVFCVVVFLTTVCVIGVKTGAIPDIPGIPAVIGLAQDFIPVIKLIIAPGA